MIPTLMDLPTQGVYMHIFGEFKTANLFFKLISPFARGGYESFLLSLVTESSVNLTLILANELLAGFAQHIIKLDDAYKAFDHERKHFIADVTKLNEIKSFFYSYFESIKPAIKTLVMAEHRYQALFKAARDAILIMNRDSGILIDVNLEAEKLIEKKKEEIVGKKALQFDLFDEGLVDPNMVKHLIDQPPPIISRIKKSTGTYMYLEVTVNEIQLADQYFIQYLFHDITDIKVIEDKLKEQVKKTDTLNKIISIANQSNDLSGLLSKILDSFIDLFNLKGCSIYLTNKQENVARIKVHRGFPSHFFLENHELNINKNPYDIVFVKGVALINNNFPLSLEKFFEGMDVSSTAVIPLFSKFEIIGSINMIFQDSKPLLPEEMELIITVGVELGTAIERMQNREELQEIELRNHILCKHVPFSIFRISKTGVLLDFKLETKMEKITEKIFSTTNMIGKHINKFFPEEIADLLQNKIENSLQDKNSDNMKFILPFDNNQIVFQSHVVPLGEKEVLVFMRNLTRTW